MKIYYHLTTTIFEMGMKNAHSFLSDRVGESGILIIPLMR